MIKYNEQRSTDSQYNGWDYVDINYFIDQNFNANDVNIMVFEPCVLFTPCGRLWGGEYDTWSKLLYLTEGTFILAKRSCESLSWLRNCSSELTSDPETKQQETTFFMFRFSIRKLKIAVSTKSILFTFNES